MDNTKKKTFVLSVAMAAMMLLPQTVSAQYDENRYGIQPWFGTSLLGRDASTGSDGYNLSNQQFGAGGYQLSNQTFGQTTPIGSGLAILVVAGMGYAATKSRKKNQKSNK